MGEDANQAGRHARARRLVPDPDNGSLRPDVYGHDWSPDGTRIVYNSTARQLFVADLLAGNVSPSLTADERVATPVWSPDDTKIAFGIAICNGGIATINPDGSEQKLIIRSHCGKSVSVFDPVWSPAGSHLIYVRAGQDQNSASGFFRDIYRATANGGGKQNLTNDIGDFPGPAGWR